MKIYTIKKKKEEKKASIFPATLLSEIISKQIPKYFSIVYVKIKIKSYKKSEIKIQLNLIFESYFENLSNVNHFLRWLEVRRIFLSGEE